MQECDYLREQCTRSMDLSPPPMYAAAAVSPPSSALSAASCELIGAPESSWSPTGVGMPPLETSKMGGLTGGPASNVATATNAPIGGGNNNAPLSDQHHHLLLSAVGGGGVAKKSYTEQTDSELAELATQEISLDLQGLIDDTHFADENLFGDLMETAKKNEAGGGTSPQQSSWLAMARVATPSSSSGGSSGQNSPGSEGQNSPTSYGYHHRSSALAYLPGSVHSGASFAQLGHVNQQQQQQQQQQHHHHHHQNIQVPVYI